MIDFVLLSFAFSSSLLNTTRLLISSSLLSEFNEKPQEVVVPEPIEDTLAQLDLKAEDSDLVLNP